MHNHTQLASLQASERNKHQPPTVHPRTTRSPQLAQSTPARPDGCPGGVLRFSQRQGCWSHKSEPEPRNLDGLHSRNRQEQKSPDQGFVLVFPHRQLNRSTMFTIAENASVPRANPRRRPLWSKFHARHLSLFLRPGTGTGSYYDLLDVRKDEVWSSIVAVLQFKEMAESKAARKHSTKIPLYALCHLIISSEQKFLSKCSGFCIFKSRKTADAGKENFRLLASSHAGSIPLLKSSVSKARHRTKRTPAS